MKKSLILAFITTTLWSSATHAAGIKGSMDCTIKSQKIMEIVDGQPEEYGAFKDEAKVGDTLKLNYNFFSSLYFELKDQRRQKTLTNAYFEVSDLDDGIFGDYPSNWAVFGPNLIRGKRFDGTDLILKRYYKGDWHGVFVTSLPLSELYVSVMTLDCRQNVDKIDEVSAEIKKMAPSK